jgi:hypothetical protein
MSPIYPDEASCTSSSEPLLLHFHQPCFKFPITVFTLQTDKYTYLIYCHHTVVNYNVSIFKMNIPWGFQVTSSRRGRSLFKYLTVRSSFVCLGHSAGLYKCLLE